MLNDKLLSIIIPKNLKLFTRLISTFLIFTLRTSVTALVEQIERAVLLILRESLLAQTKDYSITGRANVISCAVGLC